MKFEAGKFYKTRDGHKAVVWMPDNGLGSMFGAIKGNDDIWGAYVWCKEERKIHCFDLVAEWTEPKPPMLLAPAIIKGRDTPPELSLYLFESEDSARSNLGANFYSWPAVPNKDGYYSVEEK